MSAVVNPAARPPSPWRVQAASTTSATGFTAPAASPSATISAPSGTPVTAARRAVPIARSSPAADPAAPTGPMVASTRSATAVSRACLDGTCQYSALG